MEAFEAWWEAGIQYNGADEIDEIMASDAWRAALEWVLTQRCTSDDANLIRADTIEKELKE